MQFLVYFLRTLLCPFFLPSKILLLTLRACFQTRNKYLESLDLGISRVWLDTPNKRIKHCRLVSFTQ